VKIDQVYYHYDPGEVPEATDFKYCPFCKTDLVTIDVDQSQRPACPNCGFIAFKGPSPGVTVWVLENDSVILGKRKNEPGRGKWGPPAGYVKFEDDYITTAVHEVKEETNLDVEITHVLNLISGFASPRFHILAIHLLARVLGGELAATDDLEDVKWFSINGDLPPMAFLEDREMVENLGNLGISGVPVSSNKRILGR
jgi:ADP-ribose pyrophosphatase YjhB (NUDIX family)